MIIIHGNKNQGKTTQVKRVIKHLLNKNKTIMGFYSEKIIINDIVIAYDLITVPQNEKYPFLNSIKKNKQQIGSFFIDKHAITKGFSQIEKAIINNTDYVIIDEVGKLELDNKGWNIAIEKLLYEFKGEIILSIRTEFIEEIIEKWKLKNIKLIFCENINFKF